MTEFAINPECRAGKCANCDGVAMDGDDFTDCQHDCHTQATNSQLLPELKTGLYPDVDEPSYHADRRAISQSGMKLILQSPAHFRWQTDNPPEPKKVFDFGSAAHALVLGVGPKIEVLEVEVEATRDGRKQKIIADNMMFRLVQEEAERVRARGNIPLLPADYQHVLAMADKLSEHHAAMELMSEGQAEVTAYAQDPDTGVWVRGRFDHLGPQLVSDYKTSTTSEPDGFLRHALSLGYEIQAATYIGLARACGHPGAAFVWIVQEKEPPYVVTVVVPPAELIERGRYLARKALERYRDCTEAGKWPGYLDDREFATPAAPQWVLRELADQEIPQW